MTNIFSLVNFPVVSGGFALLASTAASLAGLGGAAGGVGAVLGGGGLVTGLVPLAAAGALGVLGRKLIKLFNYCSLNVHINTRSVLGNVCWPCLLHHASWSVLSPDCGH